MQHLGHQQSSSEDDDRQNRFLSSTTPENGSGTAPHRERAASQPPRSGEQTFVSSPTQQPFIPSSLGGSRAPWPSSRLVSPNRAGLPQPVPIRSSSFSAQSQGNFSSAMRERAFPSTFEDDESEGLSDTYDDRLMVPPSVSRGRSYAQDISRSRSQSLATTTATRPGLVGSPYLGNTSAMQSWNESYLSNPLNIPGRFGDIRPPSTSRQSSATIDPTNMSPFVRDVGQILLDDGSAFRELWARDESGGGGSGTTSRRHSVSVVQPRRGIVGFNAPSGDVPDEQPSSRPGFSQTYGGRGGLLLSDDDLASDLGVLNLGPPEPPNSSSQTHPPSQPSSLPIFSRSPTSRDRLASYPSINLSIPSGSSYSSRPLASPSDLSAGGASPSRANVFDQQFGGAGTAAAAGTGPGSTGETQYRNGSPVRARQSSQSEFAARYTPGQGIQYMSPQLAASQSMGGSTSTSTAGGGAPSPVSAAYTRARAPSYSGTVTSPISPTNRLINPQQQPYYPQQMQRRPSDAPQASLTELGKGVPLHAVPSSWPLFIVEFKAGRTDLFYLTDLSQDIRVGDLVIVEADRGKDLGKVINDSITLAEVDAFQKQQQEHSGLGDGQTMSPGGTTGSAMSPSSKKDINPKMIYGKATPQDAQLLVAKSQDELKALQLCQSKVRAKKLPMEVIDAEYQWDRRKLTFYFIAEKRIDFRELVRELFRLYKTRIWMASLQGSGFEQ